MVKWMTLSYLDFWWAIWKRMTVKKVSHNRGNVINSSIVANQQSIKWHTKFGFSKGISNKKDIAIVKKSQVV